MKEVLPLIKKDFQQERKISIKNGVIDPEDDRSINEFLCDVKVADNVNYGKEVVENSFKLKHVLKSCQEPVNKVLTVVQEWTI